MSSSFIDWEDDDDDDDDDDNDDGSKLPLPLFLLLLWTDLLYSNEWNSSSYFCWGRVTKSFTLGIVKVEIKKE